MDRSLGIEHDDVRESSESCFRLNPNGWSSFFGKVRGNSGRVESVIKRAAEDTETGYVQLFNPNQWAQISGVRR